MGDLLLGKGIYGAGKGEGVLRAGKWGFKSWLWKQNGFLILPFPLINFEIQKYYTSEPRFNDVYSKNNVPKIKDYVINLDAYSDIGTHWVALYVQHNSNSVIYFDSFGVEHISTEIKVFINRPLPSPLQNKNIITNTFRIQAYDLIMCGYFCIGFIDFMFARKTLTENANLFSPNNFKKNEDTILNYFISNI